MEPTHLLKEEQNLQSENSKESSQESESNAASKKRLAAAIAIVLLAISSTAIFNGLSIYVRGLRSLSFKMTDAKVVKVIEHFDAFGIRKEALLSYKVGAETKESAAPVPAGRVMKRGEETVVYQDPANPETIVLNQEVDYDWVIVLCGYGLFVFCFGAFILYRTLNRKSGSRQDGSASATNA